MASGKGFGTAPHIEAMATATAVLDEEGNVTGWSAQAERLLGYPAEEVLGRPATELLAIPADAPVVRTNARLLREQNSWGGPVPVRARDGGQVDLMVELLPGSEDGRGPRWVVLANTSELPWWGMSRALTEQLFTLSPVCLSILDTELRYVWVNESQARLSGIPAERWQGRTPAEMVPDLDTGTAEREMREVLETGRTLAAREYTGTRPSGDTVALLVSYFRLDDGRGNAAGLCAMAMDVTERHRIRRKLDLLDRASHRIGSTLDVSLTAQELADVAVPDLADFVTVDLFLSVLQGEEPPKLGARSDPPHLPQLRRAGQQSVREGCPEAVVEVGEPSKYTASSPLLETLASGQPRLERDLDSTAVRWVQDDAQRRERIRRFGIHSVITVPLGARGEVFGIASFCRWQRPEPFTAEDTALAAEFVSRAAVSLDNARRYTREHRAALTLQRNLLPQGAPEQTAVEVASRYLPADVHAGVGGDWFDVIQLSGARVGLVVGDVVGHGLYAAATMGRLRTAVQTLADLDLSPEELLAHLDDMIARLTEEEGHGRSSAEAGVLGATCLYAVYDPVSRSCVIARAGHPPPVLVPPGGEAQLLELPVGAPLGLGGVPFESAEFVLEEGSLLALYTNGLISGPDADVDARVHRLRSALSTPDGSLQELAEDVVGVSSADRSADDVALLLARTRTLGSGQVASWDVPFEPAAVGGIRSMAARQLAEWGLEELSFTTELVISELVTNALRHGSPPVRLRMIRDRALICEVSDSSNTSPRLRRARMTDEGGRGLFLVAQVTQHWGTRYTRDLGKTVWTQQPFTPVAPPLESGLEAVLALDGDLGLDGESGGPEDEG